jgi:hypothetical protein
VREDVRSILFSKLAEVVSSSATIKGFLQARIHEAFTVSADRLAQLGFLSIDDRIKLSSCIGESLKLFNETVSKELGDAVEVVIPQDIIQRIVFS